MENCTQEQLIKAIEVLADKITKEPLKLKADDALKYTQAALNAANAIRTLMPNPNNKSN